MYSVKCGPGLMGMLVLRGDSIVELDSLLRDADELLQGPIAALNEDMQAISNVQTAFSGSTVVSNTPAATGPVCGPNGSHGPMVYRTGGSGSDRWEGHFCPLPKGDPNKCRPVYPGK